MYVNFKKVYNIDGAKMNLSQNQTFYTSACQMW